MPSSQKVVSFDNLPRALLRLPLIRWLQTVETSAFDPTLSASGAPTASDWSQSGLPVITFCFDCARRQIADLRSLVLLLTDFADLGVACSSSVRPSSWTEIDIASTASSMVLSAWRLLLFLPDLDFWLQCLPGHHKCVDCFPFAGASCSNHSLGCRGSKNDQCAKDHLQPLKPAWWSLTSLWMEKDGETKTSC